jgi:hypothetical protein
LRDGDGWSALGGVPNFSWIISITWDPQRGELLRNAAQHDQSWV